MEMRRMRRPRPSQRVKQTSESVQDNHEPTAVPWTFVESETLFPISILPTAFAIGEQVAARLGFWVAR